MGPVTMVSALIYAVLIFQKLTLASANSNPSLLQRQYFQLYFTEIVHRVKLLINCIFREK